MKYLLILLFSITAEAKVSCKLATQAGQETQHSFQYITIQIDNVEKVSSYVRKYITKDMPTFHGKNRYFCSQGLQRPEVHKNSDILYNPDIFPHMTEVFSTLNFSIYRSNDTLDIQLIKESVKWQTHHNSNLKKESLTQRISREQLPLKPEELRTALALGSV